MPIAGWDDELGLIGPKHRAVGLCCPCNLGINIYMSRITRPVTTVLLRGMGGNASPYSIRRSRQTRST